MLPSRYLKIILFLSNIIKVFKVGRYLLDATETDVVPVTEDSADGPGSPRVTSQDPQAGNEGGRQGPRLQPEVLLAVEAQVGGRSAQGVTGEDCRRREERKVREHYEEPHAALRLETFLELLSVSASQNLKRISRQTTTAQWLPQSRLLHKVI